MHGFVPVYPNLATQITLIRLFLVPAMAVAMIYGEHGLALLTFIAAALSDALDGFVARRLRQHTQIGAILDPLADKAIVLTAFVLLGQEGDPFIGLPAWLIAVVIFRDALTIVGVGAMHLVTGGVPWGATWYGKINTVVQMATLVAAMLINSLIEIGVSPPTALLVLLQILIWGTLAATVAAAFDYSLRGMRLLGEQEPSEQASDSHPASSSAPDSAQDRDG